MKNYDLRPATSSDKARIFESYRITVGPYIAKAWGWDESFQQENFWKYHPLPQFQVIQIANHFGGALHVEDGESDLFVRMIFLLPEFQGLAIGSRLLTDLHGAAQAKGKGLSSKVIRCNPAKRLYDRLGFVVCDDSSYDMRWM